MFNPDLLQESDVQSTEPAANEGGLDDTGLGDCEDSVVADDAVEAEREGNKDPRTRLALSREASFIMSIRNLEGFLGGFVAGGRGGGFGWTAAKVVAGRRVIWIECGRRCLGRQRGVGNPGDCEVSVDVGGV